MADVEQRQQREQQRHQKPDRRALSGGARREPEGGIQPRRVRHDRAQPGDSGGGEGDADRAAGEAHQRDLSHVHGEDLAGAGAHALQHGDASQLLLHEDANDAPDAHPAEDHDDEARQAHVVLGPAQIPSELVLGRSGRSDRHEPVAQGVAQVSRQALRLRFGQCQQEPPGDPAAEAHESRGLEVADIDEHACAETETSRASPRLGVDEAADGESRVADDQLVSDRDVELRQQIRAHQDPAPIDKAEAIRPPALQEGRAVERVRPIDAHHFHEARGRPGGIGRPHHGCRLDLDRPCANRMPGHQALDRLLIGVVPLAAGRQREVGAEQRARLSPQRDAHALHDRPQGHDGGDADREAEEEEQEAPPAPAHLPQRHADDEHGVSGRRRRRGRRAGAGGHRHDRRAPRRGWRASASRRACAGSRGAVP